MFAICRTPFAKKASNLYGNVDQIEPSCIQGCQVRGDDFSTIKICTNCLDNSVMAWSFLVLVDPKTRENIVSTVKSELTTTLFKSQFESF